MGIYAINVAAFRQKKYGVLYHFNARAVNLLSILENL